MMKASISSQLQLCKRRRRGAIFFSKIQEEGGDTHKPQSLWQPPSGFNFSQPPAKISSPIFSQASSPPPFVFFYPSQTAPLKKNSPRSFVFLPILLPHQTQTSRPRQLPYPPLSRSCSSPSTRSFPPQQRLLRRRSLQPEHSGAHGPIYVRRLLFLQTISGVLQRQQLLLHSSSLSAAPFVLRNSSTGSEPPIAARNSGAHGSPICPPPVSSTPPQPPDLSPGEGENNEMKTEKTGE